MFEAETIVKDGEDTMDMNIKNEKIKVVIEARVREVLGEGAKLSGDCIDSLNDRVVQLIKEAKVRAEANGRKTLQAQDF